MFKPGDECMTRDGRKARIYAVDGSEGYPIHGAVRYMDGWINRSWKDDGRFYGHSKSEEDLMPPKRKEWVNVNAGGVLLLYPTRKEADNNAGNGRIACIEIEYHEGQGLPEGKL